MQKVMTFKNDENTFMTFKRKSHDFENSNHEKVMSVKKIEDHKKMSVMLYCLFQHLQMQKMTIALQHQSLIVIQSLLVFSNIHLFVSSNY